MKKTKKEKKQRQGISLKYKGDAVDSNVDFCSDRGDTYASVTAD